MKDLKGKKIAVGCVGCVSYIRTLHLLQDAGLNTSDVDLVVMPDVNQRVKALKSSGVYAATAPILTFSPGEVKMMIYLSKDSPSSISGAVIARDDFIKEHPDTVMRFVTAMAKTVNFIYSEKAGTIELIKSGMEVNDQTAQQIYSFIIDNKFYVANLNATNVDAEIKEVTQVSGKNPISVDSFIDATFVNNLPKELIR